MTSREKVFGPGRAVPLDRNAKARIAAYARAWDRRHRQPLARLIIVVQVQYRRGAYGSTPPHRRLSRRLHATWAGPQLWQLPVCSMAGVKMDSFGE